MTGATGMPRDRPRDGWRRPAWTPSVPGSTTVKLAAARPSRPPWRDRRGAHTLTAPMVRRSLLVALVLATAAACSSGSDAGAHKGDVAAVPVTVARAEQRDAPVTVRAIGTVEAYSTVALKPQVDGRLAQVHFTEGQEVKHDDLLFVLDTRPFEAALRQAEANLARDRALAE